MYHPTPGGENFSFHLLFLLPRWLVLTWDSCLFEPVRPRVRYSSDKMPFVALTEFCSRE